MKEWTEEYPLHTLGAKTRKETEWDWQRPMNLMVYDEEELICPPWPGSIGGLCGFLKCEGLLAFISWLAWSGARPRRFKTCFRSCIGPLLQLTTFPHFAVRIHFFFFLHLLLLLLDMPAVLSDWFRLQFFFCEWNQGS